MADDLQIIKSTCSLLLQQQDQMRQDLYIADLKYQLLLKLLYDKKALPANDLETNWQPFLWNVVGSPNGQGMLKGFIKVSHYA